MVYSPFPFFFRSGDRGNRGNRTTLCPNAALNTGGDQTLRAPREAEGRRRCLFFLPSRAVSSARPSPSLLVIFLCTSGETEGRRRLLLAGKEKEDKSLSRQFCVSSRLLFLYYFCVPCDFGSISFYSPSNRADTRSHARL